jgi:hypothetical protein
MAIKNEVVVECVFILANASFDDGRIFQAGKPVGEVLTDFGNRSATGDTLSRGRIELRSAGVVGYLEASLLVARDSIEESAAVVCPHG